MNIKRRNKSKQYKRKREHKKKKTQTNKRTTSSVHSTIQIQSKPHAAQTWHLMLYLLYIFIIVTGIEQS